MIATIGIMMGTYIVTRMLSIVFNKWSKGENFVRVAAVITIIVAIFGIIDLLTTGVSVPRSF